MVEHLAEPGLRQRRQRQVAGAGLGEVMTDVDRPASAQLAQFGEQLAHAEDVARLVVRGDVDVRGDQE